MVLLLILPDLVDHLATSLAQAYEALHYHRDTCEVILFVENVMVFARRQPFVNCAIALSCRGRQTHKEIPVFERR